VVVDEAAMVGTRKLARLVDACARAEAKLVFVGDPKQLPAIDAGGLFEALASRLGTTQLSGNRRQRNPASGRPSPTSGTATCSAPSSASAASAVSPCSPMPMP